MPTPPDGVTAVSLRKPRAAGTATRVILVTAAFVAAVAVLAIVARPPARLDLVQGSPDGAVAGAFHIHTNRSDGRGSPDDVARAAAQAGLQFVVLTDHGDGTRTPDPPTYRRGVLCLEGVEISTSGGHYIALDMLPAPYPLGGEARDVIDDVRRLGGFGIVAHPDSPKADLAWRDWTLPFDGVELVNLDTGWRRRVGESPWRSPFNLLRALAGYPLRPAETLASLLTATHTDLSAYDAASRGRSVVGVGGADAHARLALMAGEPGDRFSLPFPGYASLFRALSNRVRIDRPLSGDAARDGAAILEAIREGRMYTVADGLASPPSFEFTAERDGYLIHEGGRIGQGGLVALRVRSNAPSFFTTFIRSGERVLAAGNGPELTVRVDGPGAYRAEIRASDADGERLWLLSNPIYVGEEQTHPGDASAGAAPQEVRFLYNGGDGKDWNVEADPQSKATLEVTPAPDRQLKLTYRLADGASAGQFAALAQGTPRGVEPFDRLSFSARSDHPMRLSLQLRADETPGRDDRWQRSLYIDGTVRTYTVPFTDLRPISSAHEGAPRPESVHSVMFVVELTNTKPGTAGTLWIGNIRLER